MAGPRALCGSRDVETQDVGSNWVWLILPSLTSNHGRGFTAAAHRRQVTSHRRQLLTRDHVGDVRQEGGQRRAGAVRQGEEGVRQRGAMLRGEAAQEGPQVRRLCAQEASQPRRDAGDEGAHPEQHGPEGGGARAG